MTSNKRVQIQKLNSIAYIFVAFLLIVGSVAPSFSNEEGVRSSQISLEKISDDEVRIFIDGDFYAAYRSDFKGTPIVWPICAPNHALVTRAWPMISEVDVEAEKTPVMKEIYQNAIISERGGVKDHPHHRSLWFNHGNVLGGDFWGGTPSVIKQTKLLKAVCVENTALIETENVWYNDILNRNICRDLRKLTFGQLSINGKAVRYLDFDIEVFALEDGVIFGDTKEGSFGIRVPSPMAMTTQKLNSNWGGTILNDAGETGNEAWGKRSLWVNYTGPVEQFLTGDKLAQEFLQDESNDFPLTRAGIAVLSGPNSIGAPAWRHVRDYGLFSSNPFGQRDFEPQNPQANGEQRLNKDESLKFSFRVLFHDDVLSPEDLSQAYQEYTAQ